MISHSLRFLAIVLTPMIILFLMMVLGALLAIVAARFLLNRNSKPRLSAPDFADPSTLSKPEPHVDTSSSATFPISEPGQSEAAEGQHTFDIPSFEASRRYPASSIEDRQQEESPQVETVIPIDAEERAVSPVEDLAETKTVRRPNLEKTLGLTDSRELEPRELEQVIGKDARSQTEGESIEIEPNVPAMDPTMTSENDAPAQIVLSEKLPSLTADVPSAVASEEDSIKGAEEPQEVEDTDQTPIEAQEQIIGEDQPDAPLAIVETVSSDVEQEKKKRKKPPKYSPSIRTGEATSAKRIEGATEAQSSKTRSFSMRVRIVFSRRNYQFSLLPERDDDSPEELEVTSAIALEPFCEKLVQSS